MAKKKTAKALKSVGVEPAAAGIDFTELFDKTIAKVAKQSGKDVTDLDGNRRAALVGIPLGHLALEILFSENVLELGRVLCFDGLHASGKTSFLWEICRLFDKANGGSLIVDTEHKATENLGPGIVGYDVWPKIGYEAADTIEEAFRYYTNLTDLAATQAKTKGKRIPLLLGMDSITGVPTESETKKIDAEGTSGRSFSGSALLSSKYLPYLTSRISNMPITFIAVRHVRQVEGSYGITTFEAKGGGEWDYNACRTYRLTKSGADENKAGSGGRPITIFLVKGTGEGIRIPVTLRWRDTPDENGENVRTFQWDWPQASFKLLGDLSKFHVPLRIQKAVKEVLGAMNISGGKVNCKALGLQGANAVDFETALYDPVNAQVLTAVRAAFCIRVGQEFRGGDDFDELKTIQREIMMNRRGAEAVPMMDDDTVDND